MRVAIIGAGVAGLSAARELAAQGTHVQLFDKSRGVGGRMTTRYAGDWEFDHGAQYFTVSDEGFRAEIDKAVAAGVAAPWSARAVYLKTGELTSDTGRPRFVGAPRMNALPKFWAEGLDIQTGRRVATALRGESWTLTLRTGPQSRAMMRLYRLCHPRRQKTFYPLISPKCLSFARQKCTFVSP